MYYCTFCNFSTSHLGAHLNHRHSHRHISSYICCGFNRCSKSFKTESYFKIHLQRNHGLSIRQENPSSVSSANEMGKFVCTMSLCQNECDTFSENTLPLYSDMMF